MAARPAQGEQPSERAADPRALCRLPRALRTRSQILRLLERFDRRAVALSRAVRAAGTADRQLHPLASRTESGTSVESSLSARTRIGYAAGCELGRGRRS